MSSNKPKKPDQAPPVATADDPKMGVIGWVSIVAAVLAIGWAYFPALSEMLAAWGRDPDYSHGYLVAPIAAFFLWARRDKLDASLLAPNWWGLAVLLIALLMRAMSGWYFLGPVDAWTLLVTLSGAVLLLFGWHCLKWCLPSLAFLFFMFPLPYSMETWLSVPLQQLATRLSTETLQLLGQPAIAEGNVIWIEDYPLFVAEACSGLRILVGVFALAFAYVLFSRWSWWQKIIVLAAAVPVALAANCVRIVVTGLLYRAFSSDVAHQFGHDTAGVLMIPLAAGMFWLLLVYLEKLFPLVVEVSMLDTVGGSKRSG
ncbi:Transmembrane exosortase [Pseudobythopirellula maris]|uniref:Transmembrane exosortase n=1 Tax=Pseudobythopirellula maris TaxID=2527991 RepID=A0A5C5ZRL1_9BACT|nr:exosortase/archaeosortase family protein [Pseudobythopirellula maris]TWT89725.1 Transmembrane exosortase [Pseudobythopirellula maris]